MKGFEIHGYFDGACKGNHQSNSNREMRMGVRLVAFNKSTKTILKDRRISRSITEKNNSNNRSELLALMYLLWELIKRSKKLKGIPITIYGDSEYVILGIIENRKRKKNIDLWESLDKKISQVYASTGIPIIFDWIARDANTIADTLSNSRDQDELYLNTEEEVENFFEFVFKDELEEQAIQMWRSDQEDYASVCSTSDNERL